MTTELAVHAEDVVKEFVLYHNRSPNLKERFVGLVSPDYRETRERFRAVDGVDLQVEHGEAVGLYGHNGSGKSTFLKLVAGIFKPTAGRVSVSGRVAPLIELGVGFNPQLTGRENVFLNGSLFGLTNRELLRRYEAIVEFSELENFLDVPLKNYSSGMQMRLGFSVAVHLEPEILLADEVLAVGDAEFQEKCLARIREMRKQGMTLILVSHDRNTLDEFCDRYVEIEKGRVVARHACKELAEGREAS